MKLVATLYFDTEMAIKNASYHAVVLSYTNISPCLSCRIFRHIAEVRCQEQLRNVRKHCFKCGSKAGTKSRTSSGQEQPALAYASNKVSEAMEPAWVDTILLRYAMYAKVIMII